jgi:hypothetical protein
VVGRLGERERIRKARVHPAFYAAFENVGPTGKRLLLALDVSGSMTDGRRRFRHGDAAADRRLRPRHALSPRPEQTTGERRRAAAAQVPAAAP